MNDHHGNVWLAPPPPPAVLPLMNLVTRPSLRSFLGRRLAGVMLLEFRGRRTGTWHLCGHLRLPPSSALH